MKIRLFGDSIRLRLTQLEVETLAAGGDVESVTPFPDEAFTCTIQPSNGPLSVHHAGGRLTVLVPRIRTAEWAASSDEGMYGEQVLLRIAVEKDYRCIHQPESPANAGTFPNPAATGD